MRIHVLLANGTHTDISWGSQHFSPAESPLSSERNTEFQLNKTPSRLLREATRSLYTAHTSRKVHLNRQGRLSEDK